MSGQLTSGWFRHSVGSFSLEFEWSLSPSQVLVLFGPSGAGKSTALKLMAGLAKPREGKIEIGGRVVFDSAAGVWAPAHRRRVGYLTQQCHLFPHLKVNQNIGYGLRGLPAREREATVRYWLETLHLDGLEQRRPWELSGGQQQRVALARALAPGPDLLLLDEPFSSLDPELRRILQRELRSMLTQREIPVVVVTHDREEALVLGDWVQVLDEGRVIDSGPPLQVLGQPGQGRVARLVGVENLLELEVESRNAEDGTMFCTAGDFKLEVPFSEPDPGSGGHSTGPLPKADRVNVGIRASDIILAEVRANRDIGSEPPAGYSHRCRAAAPRLHRDVGLRPDPPVPHHPGIADGNGCHAGKAHVGGLQSIVLFPGRIQPLTLDNRSKFDRPIPKNLLFGQKIGGPGFVLAAG